MPSTTGKSALLRLFEFLPGCIYRVESHGVGNLHAGGCLLVPNHLTWVDAVVLQLASPRPIRFVIDESIYQHRLLNPLFRFVGAIPISSRKARGALNAAIESLRAGECVCIFPEGALSRTGTLLRLRRGFEIIARAAEVPVVPVWLDQLWGSIFSFHGGRFFTKIPKRIPYAVTVLFGAAIPAETADVAGVRQALLEMGERCFSGRRALDEHLGRASLRGLKRRQFDLAVFDGFDGSKMSRGTLLAAGIALARRIKKSVTADRVGVVLPSGRGAMIANLAAVLADKVAVNFNFTVGPAALASAAKIADLRHVLTAGPMQKKVPEFPWPNEVWRLEELLPAMKKEIAFWRVAVLLLPASVLARIAGVPRHGGHDEAVLLFTSGSSGEPKGVVLSHRNIVANVSQFASMLNLTRHDAVLASLPFFHSFGCTVTLWYPLIGGIKAVTFPNPLDAARNIELVEKHRVTLLLATPTFLRGYLRKARKEQFASVKLIVTGAEKLPLDLAATFAERFGKQIMEGYGLTETSPAVSVNLPAPDAETASAIQPSSRLGSVGKLVPGLAAQIRDPDTGALLSLHETGMLWLRGANIFERYLGDPKKTAEVLREEWFKTGDLGRFDADGFLFIEGRLSRFSKIGGEMVPHETIESKIAEVLGVSAEGERAVAIVGIPDEAKGESLVLLTTLEIDRAKLRLDLNAAGLPNLWIPKRIEKIAAIPILASGKLDLKKCREAGLAASSPTVA